MPVGPFPPPALRAGRADLPHPALQWDHAPRTRNASSEPLPAIAGHPRYRWLCVPSAPRSCTASPRCPSPTRCQTCSRPDSTEPPIGQPGPFAYACDASELPAPSRGVHRQSHSRGPSPLRHPSSPEAPFLDGHYPASSVLRASPPPCRPGLPLAGFRLPRARHRHGFPCCHAFHLPHVPTPLPRRKPAGCSRRSLPGQSAAFPFLAQGRLPRLTVSRPARRSLHVSAHVVAEAAFRLSSSLGRIHRFQLTCPFRESHYRARPVPKCFSSCRYLHEPLWLLPAGATVAGRGFAPAWKSAPFHGARKESSKFNQDCTIYHSCR